jgi:hypothetical protein
MVSYDFAYLERRASVERSFAESAANPYVRACHRRLAEHYEQELQSFMQVPPDWPLDRLDGAP